MARPVQTNEDLPEKPLVTGRLTPFAEHLHGRLGNRPGGLGVGERPGLGALRRREQARTGNHLRIAAPARDRSEWPVGPRARAGWQGDTGWEELHDPADVLVHL
ncbi:MAG: hypothetical protein K2X91_09525, partial [Thermoleophilia bacterium]|nr:hypothetical protein [Thermoleophilia bacterium]